MTELAQRHCAPCEGGTEPLSSGQAAQELKGLSDAWSLGEDGKQIAGSFSFKNYYETTAFVNAVAWIAHTQDHHPDITFGYKACEIVYSTHAIGGLSDNDFICAARIDQLQK